MATTKRTRRGATGTTAHAPTVADDLTGAGRLPLDAYLAMAYPFNVIPNPDGGYTIEFPDLPGCMTGVDAIEEVGPMAEEIRRLWLKSAYDHLDDIPLPSQPAILSSAKAGR